MKRLFLVSDQNVKKTFYHLFDQILWYEGQKITADDTLLLEGGTDVNPQYYYEARGLHTDEPDKRRDSLESFVWNTFNKAGAGSIGVCRGSQFLCVLNNGRLVQHVTGHGGNHPVELLDGTRIEVTSTHHQMMYVTKESHGKILAKADPNRSKWYFNGSNQNIVMPDSIEPEIVWFPKTKSLAIQGHPEYLDNDHPFPRYCQKLVKEYLL